MNFENYTFQYQSDNAVECRREKDNGAIEIKLIVKGEASENEQGETVNPWEDLHAAGVDIAPRDPMIAEAEAQAAAKIERDKAKIAGEVISGEAISLTEDNQNGLAAVMQGVNLAGEMGANIFPLKFNAQTPRGFKLIAFDDETAFKTFCLTFLAKRQAFFQ